MKTAIRCLICILLFAFAWVMVIECAYGIPNPSTKRIAIGVFVFVGMMLLGAYVMEPSILNKRIYAIIVCISAHRMVRKYCNEDEEERAFWLIPDKKSVLRSYTGCNVYWELYQYAKNEYFKRWVLMNNKGQ